MSSNNYPISFTTLKDKVPNFGWLPYENRKNFSIPEMAEAFVYHDTETKKIGGVYITNSDESYYFESKRTESNDPYSIVFQKKIQTLEELKSLWKERTGHELKIV